jgi:hypothetical protein
MKLSVASSAMQSVVTHNGSSIDGPKTFCSGRPGSSCVGSAKKKKFNLNGFMSISDDDPSVIIGQN